MKKVAACFGRMLLFLFQINTLQYLPDVTFNFSMFLNSWTS